MRPLRGRWLPASCKRALPYICDIFCAWRLDPRARVTHVSRMKITRPFRTLAAGVLLCLFAAMAPGTSADPVHSATPAPPSAGRGQTPAIGEARPTGAVLLLASASLSADSPALRGGLAWRVFNERAEPDGTHALIAESTDAQPGFALPDGTYIVHAAYGLASATRRVVINGRNVTERFNLNAGALKITGVIGDAPIARAKTAISIFIPERGNSEAKLVMANARAGDVIRLPEGNYHIVSTYLEIPKPGTQPAGSPAFNPTNSIITADLRVVAGKLIEATLKHRAATLTLKLVNGAGGEALANTTFNILTPGGDLIRELIGAFPSLVLAEGEYVAIARHDEKTFQTTFKVQSAQDRDVEVLAQ